MTAKELVEDIRRVDAGDGGWRLTFDDAAHEIEEYSYAKNEELCKIMDKYENALSECTKALNVIESLEDPEWHPEYEYRIKPAPKYVSFEPSDILIGKHVRSKTSPDIIHVITSQNNDSVYLGGRLCSRWELFIEYEFLDGSPCGKLKEEKK
ncbi:MAG: hypothetical protein ABFD66_00440 [Smithella sp.]